MGSSFQESTEPNPSIAEKNVRLATFKDFYPVIPGPLEHTPPLFYKLNLLNIFDIYKLQVGKLVYGSLNNLGPIQGILLQELLKSTDTQPDSLGKQLM